MSDRSKLHDDPRFAPYVQRVWERLEAQEGWQEMRQLERLSLAELELLVKMERGWGPLLSPVSTSTADLRFPQTYPLIRGGKSQGCAPSGPQAVRGGVTRMANNTDEIRVAS